jgi:hypothetical protein
MTRMNTHKNSAASEQLPLIGAQPVPAPNGENPTPPAVPSPPRPVSSGLTAAALRINPAAETAFVRRLLTRVPVISRPDPQLYVQVHPDSAFHTDNLGLVEFKQDRRLYAVAPEFADLLKSYMRLHYACVATTLTGAVFLWVIKMPDADGAWNAWPQTMYECAYAACTRDWFQIQNCGAGYEPVPTHQPKPPPEWADLLHPCTTLDEVFELAFRATHINRADHPVNNALLGV